MAKAITVTKPAAQMYSRLRKAMVPSRIAAEIPRMRSLPALARMTTLPYAVARSKARAAAVKTARRARSTIG